MDPKSFMPVLVAALVIFALYRRVRRSFGPPHDFAAVDVSQEQQVERWAARMLSGHGAPDLLINNAGIINQNAPLWQVPSEEFDRVIDVNVKGGANVIRHFLPAMTARRTGLSAKT